MSKNKKSNVINIYGLSPMQQGMLFHAVKDEGSPAYVEQTIITLKGDLKPAVFKQAYQELLDRYDILRTVFVYKTTKQPRQVVLKELEADFRFEDLSGLNIRDVEAYLDSFSQGDRSRGFDLTKGPMMRATLFKIPGERWQLVWSFHHILMDGWCLGILFRDFIRIYHGLCAGSGLPLEPVVQYNQYIRWLESQDNRAGLQYWRDYLAGFDEPAGLPATYRPLKHSTYNQGLYRHVLDEGTSLTLHKVARNNQVTLNTVFQAMWTIILHNYCGHNDVVFGAVVSGRGADIRGIEEMVGLFVNTVPVRIRCENGNRCTFTNLLQRLQRSYINSRNYEYLPLAEIQALTPLKNKLFDHILAFENYPLHKNVKNAGASQSGGFEVENLVMREQTNYDLNLLVSPGPPMELKFDFNRSIYEPGVIRQVAKHFETVAYQVAEDPDRLIIDLPLLSSEERQQVLEKFNDIPCRCPLDKTLHRLFEEQVEQTPDRVALVAAPSVGGEGETPSSRDYIFSISLTYQELNEQANRLATVLSGKGVETDTIVALMSERSLEMYIGILGVLKAGGAYLPIDPYYPDERIEFMLNDSNSPFMLTSLAFENDREKIKNWQGELLVMERILYFSPFPLVSVNPVPGLDSSSLAYVIYTSGTTGRPKGVLNTHANVVRMVKDTSYIEIDSRDRMLQLSNYAFDGSVFDIFGALVNGAVLVAMRSRKLPSADYLAFVLKREQITVFFLTTALFNTLVDLEMGAFDRVRAVLFGGERVSVEHARKAFEHLGPGRIFHMYGPTETTVYASCYRIDGVDDSRFTIPIGIPLSGTRFYVLNPHMNPVPIMVTGELYIGGVCVARGYLNRPGLTTDSFFCHVFKGVSRTGADGFFTGECDPTGKGGEIRIFLYKTGDLVRWLSDGNLEFIGRVDRQVKLRGFRVELGEIESFLRRYPGVKEALVIDRGEGSNKFLCAYIVLKDQVERPEPDRWEMGIKIFLSHQLPDYMVPLYFVTLEKFPVNPSGKIDTRALPNPALLKEEAGKQVKKPRNGVEELLVQLWAEILSLPVESIGIDRDFFDLGGHSLRAMSLVARIHKDLDIKLRLNEVFEAPTIEAMARYIQDTAPGERGDQEHFQAIEPVEDQSYYLASSAQKRLFIFQQMELFSTAYNIPAYATVQGKPDGDKIQKIFSHLIERHESLRTSFHTIKGETVQVIHHTVPFKFDYSPGAEVISESEIPRVISEFVQPFDLGHAPLMRARLVKTGEDRFLFMVDMHHIITDGVSMGLFFQEFPIFYHGGTLPALHLRYRDYCHWQQQVLEPGSPHFRRLESFWLKHLEGQLPMLNLPLDFPRPSRPDYRGEHQQYIINEKQGRKLRQLGAENEATLYMVLFSLCNIWVAKLSGQEDIIIGTPVAGRSHSDLRPIMGMFVNTLVIRNFPQHHKTFKEFLVEVRQRTLDAFEHQEYPFEDLVRVKNVKTKPGRNPLFDVLFNLQNMEADKIIPGDLGTGVSDLIFTPYSQRNPVSKFDLMISAVEDGKDSIGLTIEYPVQLFKPETIGRFTRYFNEILEIVCQDPGTRLIDIRISHDLKNVESINPDMELDF